MGRRSTYTPELHAEICERLSQGEPLADICRDEHMPAVRTVSLWKATHESFAADFARAREEGFDELGAQCLRIANTPVLGETETSKEWGTEVKKADMIEHRKLQIETRLKLLAKWDPKRYGDKQQVEHSGTMTLEQLVAASMKPAPADVGDLV